MHLLIGGRSWKFLALCLYRYMYLNLKLYLYLKKELLKDGIGLGTYHVLKFERHLVNFPHSLISTVCAYAAVPVDKAE